MLSKEELFFRFNNIVPGSSFTDVKLTEIDLDIYFEPLTMSGLEEMHRYSVDVRLYEYFEFEPFDTIEKTKSYIEKLEQRMASGPLNKTTMYWFVRRKTDGYLIGSATLTALNYHRQSIEWGYGVDPELWGNGYILQIQECLKCYAFEILQLNRLHGICMTGNGRTISSVLSAGMKHEGTLRQHYCKNGIYHDGWLYGMVSSDYFEQTQNQSNKFIRCTIEDVIEVIESVLTEEIVNAETSMTNSHYWDSLSHMSIMVALTNKMGITLSPQDVTRANSVKSIAAIINKSN